MRLKKYFDSQKEQLCWSAVLAIIFTFVVLNVWQISAESIYLFATLFAMITVLFPVVIINKRRRK